MREIKFRAWDNKKKQMLLPDIPLNKFVFGINFEKITHPDNLIMLQYTGLKDKNGKEIYEGDIVKFGSWEARDCKRELKKYKGIVKYWDFLASFIVMVSDDNYFRFPNPKDGEVIGNIYENPKLIEDKGGK